MEKLTTLTPAAQIPAWIEALTRELENALKEPLAAQSERLAELHQQVQQLNQNLEMLLDVQLTQIETLQSILTQNRKKR
jgi:Na+/phosphate symporter